MKDYTFTEEQEMIRESVRDFAQKKIAPISLEMEHTKRIPEEIIKGMADLGLIACTVSPEYGGQGFNAVTAGIIAEELARADITGSIPVFYLIQAAWGHLFDKYGTHEAKSEILPKVTKGEKFLGIATTESDAGSDVAGTRTTITKKGDEYIVNGEKMYISGVREAIETDGGHITVAKQNPELGARGMTLFYLPLKQKGITPTYVDDLGREGITTGGFSVDNVKIPKKYIIGQENKGFYLIHEGYEYARGFIAVICAGAGLQSLDRGAKYLKERKAFGLPLARYEALQFKLAEHYTKLNFLMESSYKALWTLDQESIGKAKRF
ncbi:MAG: acyl-CoA dehydrogenase family protein, partial [Thermoplasmata archaeon]